jgi:hypothetical protein
MVLFAAASKGISSGERVLLVLAMLFAAWWLIVEYWFKRRKGGPKGGSDTELVGMLWFLAAVVVGIAIAVRDR